jgi:hypothetical protein
VEIAENPRLVGIELLPVDRPYHPFEQEEVVDALRSMRGFHTELTVDVYILPAPPSRVAGSYASGSAIYLAPGTGRVVPETVAYITVHEMGHVLTWAFLDGDSTRWDAYLGLRGLDAVANGPGAVHADRAREILAEDFRFLFGGSLATASGSIENHELILPDRVDGLRDMLAEFVTGRTAPVTVARAVAFPNPCNPRTTVSMSLDGVGGVNPDRAVLRIFDIRGALVRTITGADQGHNELRVAWNGADDHGSGVASGRYFYVMQAGGLRATGSVTLIR